MNDSNISCIDGSYVSPMALSAVASMPKLATILGYV